MTRAILALALTVLAACSSGRQSRPGTSADERTTLQVDNRSFTDMTVYMVNGGQRIRLGLAVGKTVTSLTIPPRVLGASRELQFLADPVGSNRTAVSDRLYVRAGDTVTLMIPPH